MTRQQTKTRPLGENQQHVLDALKRHGSFYAGCGWVWGNYSTTVRILDSLVKRGLVSRTERRLHLQGSRTVTEWKLV